MNIYLHILSCVLDALQFSKVKLSRILGFLVIFVLYICIQQCFAITKEPDLNFPGHKLVQMASKL